MTKWNGSKWIRPERRLALYLRDRFTCLYCGRDLHGALPCEITLDHLVPRNAGGTNTNENLVMACRSCNSARQDRDWQQYATGGAIERIEQQRRLPLNMRLAKALLTGTAQNAELERMR